MVKGQTHWELNQGQKRPVRKGKVNAKGIACFQISCSRGEKDITILWPRIGTDF